MGFELLSDEEDDLQDEIERELILALGAEMCGSILDEWEAGVRPALILAQMEAWTPRPPTRHALLMLEGACVYMQWVELALLTGVSSCV